MDLKEFISTTIVQIVEGIRDANDKTHSVGAVINPRLALSDTRHGSIDGILPALGDNGMTTHFIDFDIAVTTSLDSKDKVGAGIFVAAIGLGAANESQSKDSQYSRIKFKIPVCLPHGS